MRKKLSVIIRNKLNFNLQKVHPVVLAYAFLTVRQNTTILKQLIYK
jgi:hypothetical protein